MKGLEPLMTNPNFVTLPTWLHLIIFILRKNDRMVRLWFAKPEVLYTIGVQFPFFPINYY